MKKFAALLMLILVFLVSCSEYEDKESDGSDGTNTTETQGMSETFDENTPMIKVGDVIGETLYSDIGVTINGYDIATYNYNGRTMVAAEDLRNFSFNVDWNHDARTLVISRPYGTVANITSTYVAPEISADVVGTKAYDVLYTDIKTYTDDVRVAGYNVNGFTVVDINVLDHYFSGKPVKKSYNEVTKNFELTLNAPNSFTSGGAMANRYHLSDNDEYYYVQVPKFTSSTGIDPYITSQEGSLIINTYRIYSLDDINAYVADLYTEGWEEYNVGKNEDSKQLLYKKVYKNGYVDYVEIKMYFDKNGQIYRDINISYFEPGTQRGTCSCKKQGKSQCVGHTCEICYGNGVHSCPGCYGSGEKHTKWSKRCPVCNGSGELICPNCNGARTVFYKY